MHRDQFRCGYCGTKATTIDHIMPRSRGGGHSWENCVACCANCNHRKADKLLSELGWTCAWRRPRQRAGIGGCSQPSRSSIPTGSSTSTPVPPEGAEGGADIAVYDTA